MKLSEIMSNMGLHGYAEIALVLFLAAFAGVVFQVVRRVNQPLFERARRLPLEEDPEAGVVWADEASDRAGGRRRI